MGPPPCAAGRGAFLFYDHKSREPIAETLREYVAAGLVTVHRLEGAFAQEESYQHCLETYGPATRWIGFLDLDEFAVPMRCRDMRVLLSDYERYGGLVANWVAFGSSGHIRRPAAGVLRGYIQRPPLDSGLNLHVKSFVQCRHAAACRNPHYFSYKDGFYAVNEQGLPVHSSHAPFSAERIRVHHYLYRSQQDYARKVEVWPDYNERPCGADELWAGFVRQALDWTEEDRAAEPHAARLEAAARLKPAAIAALVREGGEPLSIEGCIEAVERHAARGAWEMAEHVLCAASLRHEHSPDFHLLRATTYLLQGQHERARTCVLRMLERHFDPDGYLLLADIHLAQGEACQAKTLLAYVEVLAGVSRSVGREYDQALDDKLGSLRRRIEAMTG